MIAPPTNWLPFENRTEKEQYLRAWGVPLTAGMLFYAGCYCDAVVPCVLLGHHEKSWAVVKIGEELHCIHGERLAEMQPKHAMLDTLPDAYVVLDTETTSKYPTIAEIVEIAAIKIADGEEPQTFTALVKPKHAIPVAASEINNITNIDVADAPSWESVQEELFAFIGELPIVGHNIKYDINVIQRESQCWISNSLIDTCQWAKKAFPGRKSYKLESLKEDLFSEPQASHRALADCETTRRLLLMCAERLQKQSC